MNNICITKTFQVAFLRAAINIQDHHRQYGENGAYEQACAEATKIKSSIHPQIPNNFFSVAYTSFRSALGEGRQSTLNLYLPLKA
jgi:hypothetical protein